MNITEQNQYQIIFQAKVTDVEDPAMLGRVRAVMLSNEDQSAVSKGSQWDEKKDKWTNKDPFLYLPLLPFYLSQSPKKDELINVIFQNKMYDTQNKFYIQGPFSSPLTTDFEEHQGAQANLAQGVRTKQKPTLRNQDGTYKPGTEGLFPKPEDVSLVGRGVSDIIVKDKDVLIRSGKMISNPTNPNSFPQINDNRSFIQLSFFDSNKEPAGSQTDISVVEKPTFIKKLVVWDILNIENNENVFNGSVGLYSMKELDENTTKNFTYDSIPKLSLGTNYSGPLEEIKFYVKTKEDVIKIINNFLNSVFLSSPQFTDYPVRDSNNFQNGLPFAVCPSKTLVKTVNDSQGVKTQNELIQKKNFEEIYQKVKVTNTIEDKTGFFVINSNDKGSPQFGTPTQPKIEKYEKYEIKNTPKTYAIMGGQKIYFISQDANSNKGFIKLTDTIYGIKQDSFVGPDGFDNKTFSSVRGEELISLLEKIVAFLSAHVHNPISPPDPVAAGNGQTIGEIQQLLQAAATTILNGNIRIN